MIWRHVVGVGTLILALGCREPAADRVAAGDAGPERPAAAATGPNDDEGGVSARIERPVTVVFLGDSLTAGLGLAEAEAFPARLAEALEQRGLRIEIVNAGVSGDTTAGGVERLGWVLSRRPGILVVGLGANDGLRGLPLEETEANLRRIVERGRAAGAKVLLLGMRLPPNYGPAYAEGFAAIYPRLAEELEAPLVPFLLEGVGGVAALNQADGIHPTAAGHRRLADNVLPYLAALLAPAPEP